MPRDGSSIYTQPDPDVAADTTIESAKYNNFTNDIAQDLNLPRPIVAGGTGSSSATDARFNLASEAATQLVTNYDDHLWVPGSFRSTSSATNPPVASHAFAGWCYIGEALANPPTNQNVVVHAYDFDALADTTLLYTRQKKAGVWSDWNITATEDNQAGARQAIYAAPFDAMAYNGMQINGSMEVDQLGTGTVIDGYAIDGVKVNLNGTMVVSVSTSPTGPAGFAKFLIATTTTAQASMAAANYYTLSQPIEGYRISRLAWGTASASPITIGFWSSHFRTGVYSVSVRNNAINRSYVTSYTHAASNVWQYNTITIPGDTTGTWTSDNTAGITVFFPLAAGANNIVPSPNTWTAGSYVAVTGQVNGVGATSDICRFTGVVVLPGTEAPSAARSPLIMRPYDQELLTCKRYFYNGVPALRGLCGATTTTVSRLGAPHPVTMRIAPAVTITSFLTLYDGSSFPQIATVGSSSSTITTLEFDGTMSTGTSAQFRPLIVLQGSGGNVSVDARI